MKFLLPAAAFVTITSLSLAQSAPPPPVPPGVKALRDLAYVDGGHERQKLDLYLPEKAAGPLPVVIWVHSGGWQAGTKAAGHSAYREAVTYIEQALQALPHLPESRETLEQAIDLRLDLRQAFFALTAHRSMLNPLREAEVLASLNYVSYCTPVNEVC